MQRNPFFVRFAALTIAALGLLAVPTQAGPPLICHTIDIGNAKSLPWISHDWSLTGTENYDTSKLAPDTLAILNGDATVLVQMETLRRATLYARTNPLAAKELLAKLVARANDADSAGHGGGLARFDAGYLAEAYGQWLGKDRNPAAGLDGYAWVKQALSVRGNDPQMEFAAALITLSGPAAEHRAYVEKALAGAKSDPLLARNLSSHFIGPQSQTIAELFNRDVPPTKAQR
ncbi:MAG: hypothetical protein WAK91_11510 [Candidatus Acidiferrales bacterium]|jgi:hypothetical protein